MHQTEDVRRKDLSGEISSTTNGTPQVTRRLLVRDEVLVYLQLVEETLQQLINTRQLAELRVAGELRFDLRDVDRLIDSYKTTATRRAQ